MVPFICQTVKSMAEIRAAVVPRGTRADADNLVLAKAVSSLQRVCLCRACGQKQHRHCTPLGIWGASAVPICQKLSAT